MQIDPKSLTGTWSYPTQIRFGPGRIAELILEEGTGTSGK